MKLPNPFTYIVREEPTVETKYVVYTNHPQENSHLAEYYSAYAKETREFATLEEAKAYAKSRVFLHKMYIAEIKPICAYSSEVLEHSL